MRRGTTPRHTFTTDVDLTGAEVLYVTYKQGKETILEKEIRDVHITPDTVEFALTQEETLAFQECTRVNIQIRVRFPDGTAIASNIIDASAEKILKEGVI